MQALAIVMALALTTVALFPVVASGQGHVDLILVHGKIWTENPRQPEAEAVAIQGNRILEVADSDSIQKLACRVRAHAVQRRMDPKWQLGPRTMVAGSPANSSMD
jgi:hypothetical protein